MENKIFSCIPSFCTLQLMISKCIDLTQTLNEAIPTWTGTCGFESKVIKEYDSSRVMSYAFHVSSAGTHMDAPSHFIQGAADIDKIPLEKLIVPLCVIDVTKEARSDFFISEEHILQFEKAHGKIPPNSFFAAHTGWDRYWSDIDKYRGSDEEGKVHCPGFSIESGQLLLERGIVGIGIDTLSPDGSNREYPIHFAVLGAGKYLVENLTHLGEVPPIGAYVALLPIKIEGGPEAPIRAVAMVFE